MSTPPVQVSIRCEITKRDDDRRLVFGWLYQTHDKNGQRIVDWSGEYITNDTIEKATGVNDKRFLPCVLTKEIVRKPRDARVEIVVEDIKSPSVGLPTWNTIQTP